VKPVEAGDDYEGTIALKAQLYGVAAHEFSVCCSFICHNSTSAHLIMTNYNVICVVGNSNSIVAEESVHGLREIPCWLRWRRI
jgi:hypothetical protein